MAILVLHEVQTTAMLRCQYSCDVLLPVAKPARLLVMLCKYFCVHGPRKQSISKEMNNDDLKFA